MPPSISLQYLVQMQPLQYPQPSAARSPRWRLSYGLSMGCWWWARSYKRGLFGPAIFSWSNKDSSAIQFAKCFSKQAFWISVPRSWHPSLSAPQSRTPPQSPPSKPDHRLASSTPGYSWILRSSTSSSPRSTPEPSHGPMLTTQCSPAILARLHALRIPQPRLNAGPHPPLTMVVRKREQMPLRPIPCLWLGISRDYPNMRKRQSLTWMHGQTPSKPIPTAMRRCKPAGQALHGLEPRKLSDTPTLAGPRLTSPHSRTCYEMCTSPSSSLDHPVTATGNLVSLFLASVLPLLPSSPNNR